MADAQPRVVGFAGDDVVGGEPLDGRAQRAALHHLLAHRGDHGDGAGELAAGTVFLLPYYMGLYHHFIAPPGNSP